MKIVADSGCDFTTEMKNNSNIVQVPLTLQINDEIFSDTLDLDIVNFRNKLRENKKNRKRQWQYQKSSLPFMRDRPKTEIGAL